MTGLIFVPGKNRKALRKDIGSVMRKIREATPNTAFSHDVAKGSEVWEGRFEGDPIERVIIYLRSSGCFWSMKTESGGKLKLKAGCLDCEHSVAGTTFGQAISAESYTRQFVSEYKKYDFSRYPMLCLYNEGNFFNNDELPNKARREILTRIAKDSKIKALILECLPEFITEEMLRETKNILGDKYVEIGIGLESSNQTVRDLCVNKSFSLSKFEEAAQLVNEYFNTLVYVLVKPSFLTEDEALHDSITTIEYAFRVGVKVVSIEPISVTKYSMAGALGEAGIYRPPWLWTVLEIAKVSVRLGETRIGGYQFAPRYESYARNCEKCTMDLKAAICHFNATNDLTKAQQINCDCKLKWETELAKQYVSLADRIPQYLARVSNTYQ